MKTIALTFSLSISLLAALAAAPADATTAFQKPQPMSRKYRDERRNHATGRSGSASLETRAMLGGNGSTVLDITTGSLSDGTAGPGVLEKVQVKFLTPGGDVLQTNNYQKTLAGAGSAQFQYTSLTRGQLIQTQANITGVDRKRTDVVTVNASVGLNPDLQALSMNAPAEALVDSQVIVTGVMGEMNGDFGAHATCRLLADGVEVGNTADAWVEAGSVVTCQFQTSFSTAGTRQLAFEVSGVSPADYDGSNNRVTRSIEIAAPQSQTYQFMQASAWQNVIDQEDRVDHTFSWDDGSFGGTYSSEQGSHGVFQSHGVYARFDGLASRYAGTITLIESGDGSVMGTTTVNVADLPDGYDYGFNNGCRSGLTDNGLSVSICSYGSRTEISAYFGAGETTYFDRGSSTGDFWGYNTWSNSGANQFGGGIPAFKNLGTLYTATLLHEAEGFSNHGTLTAVLRNVTFRATDMTGRCGLTIWPQKGEDRYCFVYYRYSNVAYGGEAFRFQ